MVSGPRQATEIGSPRRKYKIPLGLVGMTEMWHLFALYSFKLIASGLRTRTHKGVGHTIKSKYVEDTRTYAQACSASS